MTPRLTPAQVAELWGCSVAFVISLVKSGELPGFPLTEPGSPKPRYRIRPEDLEAFEKKRMSRPADLPQPRRRQAAGVIEFF